MKSFTVRVKDLACDGAKFPADALNVKLVKRWFRCGGAWLSYHRDGRQRILTPHLLVNDDDLVAAIPQLGGVIIDTWNNEPYVNPILMEKGRAFATSSTG